MAGPLNKKIIVCCDGTWQNADAGYTKPSLLRHRPYGMLQIPSNVVRINRALLRHDFQGQPQIVYYQAGVGSGSGRLNKAIGGVLGSGVSENIREAYSFVTTNYVPGDQIILIGFSRGAFTARSVAGLIHDIGLLTRHGMDYFYAIFRDIENATNPKYHDIFPSTPFPHKPRGKHMVERYRRRLLENELTRTMDPNGRPIEIRAVAVWDTVGSLGIPSLGWLQSMDVTQTAKELKFYDTALNNTIRHAFQALALDEHRGPFTPAVWERPHGNRTDLRQVWFPGAHANVGGGYEDQEIANITLAWMMDQLASIGVEFQDETIDRIFAENAHFYEHPPTNPPSLTGSFSQSARPWAISDVYETHRPIRPWGLGKIYNSDTGFYRLTRRINRIPGQYQRADPDTGERTNIPMLHTNERIHSSVRIRLDLGGLGLDDKGPYDCPALLAKGHWKLRQIRINVFDPVSRDANWGTGIGASGLVPNPEPDDGFRWVWRWVGPRKEAPAIRTMIEENLGPYERRLLLMNKGKEPRRRRRRRAEKSSSDYISP